MTSQRIHALPLHLANQIAAGEVVERPASVLKELVENSIDAGASQIDIQIEGAGSQLIKVSDNGRGIHPEDLALALSRHATSKLYSSEQLSHIASLGFRGEALPSIASVSRLTLCSKQVDQECGWQLNSETEQAEPAAHPDGTSVSVAELFFNLPARRRFLRSDKTELQHLISSFNRLALSRFDIGFSARFGDQNFIKLPALADFKQYPQRIAKICGSAFVREACYLEQQFEDIQLTGWVGKRNAHRAQTDVQYFFINGRVIRDRIINHAIRQAYGDALPAGRQAAYVLYLTLPLDRVDVNVHPTKHEVRFRDARLIHGLITRAVEEALAEETTATGQNELPLAQAEPRVAEAAKTYQSHNTNTPLKADRQAIASAHQHDNIVLLHQRYALMTSPEPALVDLQSADQALRQQQLKQAIASGQLTSRPILVPLQLSLTRSELALLSDNQALLERHAFVFELTADSAAIKRIPYLLSQVDLQQLIKAVLTALSEMRQTETTLVEPMQQLIPLHPVSSAADAQQILAELEQQPALFARWRQKLDPATLTGLFSD